jgi:hypothetical protein
MLISRRDTVTQLYTTAHGQTTNYITFARSGVELNLRPTVSRRVRFGVGPPFGAHDQNLHVL